MLHTRANELQLLFLPFLLVLIPFAAASFKQPRHLPGIDRRQFDRLVRNSVGIEQSSTLILLLMQFVAVMAGSSRRMWLAWAAAAPFLPAICFDTNCWPEILDQSSTLAV